MPLEPTTEQLIARGKEAYGRSAYLAALEDLEEVVRREPRFADVHNVIGLCLSLTGRPDAAVEAFDRAVAVNPRYVEAHLNRAITLNDLGRLDEAREAFASAASSDEDRSGRFSSPCRRSWPTGTPSWATCTPRQAPSRRPRSSTAARARSGRASWTCATSWRAP
jgi:tetratricopeptide (TPR) repeat protein